VIDWSSTGSVTAIEGTVLQLEKLRSYAAALGCQIGPSSRIAVFERHFRRFLIPAYHPRDDPHFDPPGLAHGNRDLFELNFICDKLAKDHPTELRDALPRLLSGAPTPSADGRNRLARNLQFQFFLAGQLAHSGYPITLQEPDAIFVFDGAAYGVAVKRPISAQQVVRRVREGVKQLSRENLTGFIALSLDHLLPFPDPYIFAAGEAALDIAAKFHLRQAFDPHVGALRRAISGTNITGLVISLTLVGCVRVPWQPAHTTATLSLPREDDLPREEQLVQTIVKGLSGPSLN